MNQIEPYAEHTSVTVTSEFYKPSYRKAAVKSVMLGENNNTKSPQCPAQGLL